MEVWGLRPLCWVAESGRRGDRNRETEQISGFSRERDHVTQVVDMTNVLVTLQQEGVCVTPEAVSRLSPYLTEHIKRFGQYMLQNL
jgi:hypothetical protein